MPKLARQLLIVLIAFAIVGGTTTQLAYAEPARSAQYAGPVTMAAIPCGMEMPAAGSEHGKRLMPGDGMPCKGMTPECLKQMGCVTITALPAQIACNEIAVSFSAVDYWASWSALPGLVREPEPLPPRTA